MSELVQKALNERCTQRICEGKTRKVFHLLLCKLFEYFRHGSKLIHEVQAPQTVGDLQLGFVSTKRPSFLLGQVNSMQLSVQVEGMG